MTQSGAKTPLVSLLVIRGATRSLPDFLIAIPASPVVDLGEPAVDPESRWSSWLEGDPDPGTGAEKRGKMEKLELPGSGLVITVGEAYRFDIGKVPDPTGPTWELLAIERESPDDELVLQKVTFGRGTEVLQVLESESGHLKAPPDYLRVLIFALPGQTYVQVSDESKAPVSSSLIKRGVLSTGSWLEEWAFAQIVTANGGDWKMESSHLRSVVAEGDAGIVLQD